MGRRTKLVLVGGKRPKVQQAAKRNWTKAKEQTFLSVLAETCNVTRAAEAAGMSVRGAYLHRKKNAAFRAGWQESLSIAYHRLELVLLDRAFNGTERITVRRDGTEERMREYSNQLGLQLLKMHRDAAIAADADANPAEIEDGRERLVQKLLRLKNRIESETRPDGL